MRTDYIFILYGCAPFPFKGFSPTPFAIEPYSCCHISITNGIVFEVSSIRGLLADCPLKKSRGFNLALIQLIFSTFVTITFRRISSLRCGLIVFRIFQQLNAYFFMQLTLHGHYIYKHYIS